MHVTRSSERRATPRPGPDRRAEPKQKPPKKKGA